MTSFSNLYEAKFIRAVYFKKAIILKGARYREMSFLRDYPKKLKPFEIFLGSDENGSPFIINTYQRVSFLIGGEMGSGKSILADRIRLSLMRSNEEGRSYIFCKNRNDFTQTDTTVFVQKDDKAAVLRTLKMIKGEVLERQKEIELGGYRSAYEANYRPYYLIADEVHSYGKNLGATYSKEERQEQAEIIEIFRFLLLQGRSSLVHLIFITPNLEKNETDLNLRDCAFYFSSKLNSEEVANNLFGSSQSYLMPREVGLFAFTDKNQERLLKVSRD
jgi:protease II